MKDSNQFAFKVTKLGDYSENLQEANKQIVVLKPLYCTHCHTGNDPMFQEYALFKTAKKYIYLVYLSFQCTLCKSITIMNYEFDTSKKTTNFIGFYPPNKATYKNDTFQTHASRFVELYYQALNAEINDDKDLAAVGYRCAVEFLIKTYAIDELQVPEKDIPQSLKKCISNFLGDPELINGADVVRILANDYAHFEKTFPEYDFEVLKNYLDATLHLLEVKFKLRHPPVDREKEQQAFRKAKDRAGE